MSQQDQQPDINDDSAAVEKARQLALDRVVGAEKFKATVEVSQGISHYNPDNDDDTFFMNTCHTDENINGQIAVGKFVDMNKIYPRQNDYRASQDNRMELINKDGKTFFVPANENNKRVYNFQTWQKAFRVYATIYSRANLHRAAEILQYMDIIGNAASTFSWENVAAYDYVHRQLMDQKPKRTWSKIYQQGWSMSLKDHINVRGHFQNKKGQNGNGRKSDSKDPYCWKYNKGSCRRTNCRFDHRCSYCGATGHGSHMCCKKAQNESGEDKRIVEEQTKN